MEAIAPSITNMNEAKPKRIKRRYDDAFRRNAVALVESSGKSLSEIAAELGVSHWSLRASSLVPKLSLGTRLSGQWHCFY